MISDQPTPPDEPTEVPSTSGLCTADRMQRRHCAFYHEKTGRCTQSTSGTWQERKARRADEAPADGG